MVESEHRIVTGFGNMVDAVVRFRAVAQTLQIWTNGVLLEMRDVSPPYAIYCASKITPMSKINFD